ncbi:hypothetical protein [Verrucomicrobium sp. BvORR106]|uniref:hypothetical protein n=1 Tax=Verrucomicrobium sp. BvORR106 TaxID=1403819 RepID=UPI00056E9E10|nr:hypothetical protein [Verrucomicrobium sp. BvORR106]
MNSDTHHPGPRRWDNEHEEIQQILRDYGLTSARSRVAWQADMLHCYYWRLFGIMETHGWKMETVMQHGLWHCVLNGVIRLVAEAAACTADPLGALVLDAVANLEERIKHYGIQVAGEIDVMKMEVDLQRALENLEVTLSVVYAGIPMGRPYDRNVESSAVRLGWRDWEAELE